MPDPVYSLSTGIDFGRRIQFDVYDDRVVQIDRSKLKDYPFAKVKAGWTLLGWAMGSQDARNIIPIHVQGNVKHSKFFGLGIGFCIQRDKANADVFDQACAYMTERMQLLVPGAQEALEHGTPCGPGRSCRLTPTVLHTKQGPIAVTGRSRTSFTTTGAVVQSANLELVTSTGQPQRVHVELRGLWNWIALQTIRAIPIV